MNVAIAYPAFFGSFAKFFPELETFKHGKKYDLVIFSGGEDINPEIYGQRNLYSDFNQERDRVEVEILDMILSTTNSAMPYILGVCRGHQLINARFGIGLVQDIKKEIGEGHPGYHEITPLEGTVAQTFFREKNGKLYVNSMHHQGFRPDASIRSGHVIKTTSHYNGIAEVSESKKIITVQSHPEFSQNKEFFEWIKGVVKSKGSFYQPSSEIKVEIQEEERQTKSKSKGAKKFPEFNFKYEIPKPVREDLEKIREERLRESNERIEEMKKNNSSNEGYTNTVEFVPNRIYYTNTNTVAGYTISDLELEKAKKEASEDENTRRLLEFLDEDLENDSFPLKDEIEEEVDDNDVP